MIKGGVGGSSTITGLKFESDTNLASMLNDSGIYNVKGNKLFLDNNEIGIIAPKHSLYKDILEPRGIDYTQYISKQLLPDEALYLYDTETIYIIEKKWQQCSGSVDEKLQTCDFKKKQYTKLFSNLDIQVEYIYLLNDWFEDPSYRDVLDYIESCDCHYYFKELPLSSIDLI